jgi:putative YhgA-like transposase
MISTPHDLLFKAVLGRPEHARGALRAVVPPMLAQELDWSTLTLRPGSFVDSALAHRHTDLLYTAAWHDGGEAFVYFLFEHLCGAPHKCSYAEPRFMRIGTEPRRCYSAQDRVLRREADAGGLPSRSGNYA